MVPGSGQVPHGWPQGEIALLFVRDLCGV